MIGLGYLGRGYKEWGTGPGEVKVGKYGRRGAGLPVADLLSPRLPSLPTAHISHRAGFKPQRGMHGGLQPRGLGDLERECPRVPLPCGYL